MALSQSVYVARSRQIKQWTFASLVFLLALFGLKMGYDWIRFPDHPAGAQQSRSGIKARALRIGTALCGSANLITEPILRNERQYNYGRPTHAAHIWVVLCEAGGQQMNLVFDDKTGRVVCLIMEGTYRSHKSHLIDTPVTTERQAVTMAVQRLKNLEVLPSGTQIALRDKPQILPEAQGWGINWLVRLPGQVEPHTMKITLDSKTGRPTFLADVQPCL